MLENTNFWVLLGFLVFVVLAGKKIWAAVVDLLDKHTSTISRQLKESADLRAEAEAALDKARKAAAEAKSEMEEIVRHSKELAATMAANAEKDLTEALARRQKAALDKIGQAEAAALAEVRSVAVDVAIAATAKLLTEKATGSLAAQMIDGAIADLPSRIN
jgi:F-type H+-transporting ATPase subunit b